MAGLFYACFLRGLIVSLLSDLSGFVFYCVVVSSQNDGSIGFFFQVLEVLLAWVCQCCMFYCFDFVCRSTRICVDQF